MLTGHEYLVHLWLVNVSRVVVLVKICDTIPKQFLGSRLNISVGKLYTAEDKMVALLDLEVVVREIQVKGIVRLSLYHQFP